MFDHLKEISSACFKEHLVGIYIHGSYVLDDFHWDHSDLDVIIVVDQEPELKYKQQFLEELVMMEDILPAGGIELSLLLLADTQHFCHPMPYVFHYSNMHACRARQDPQAYCSAMHGVDPDLACHLRLIRQSGYVLFGRAIEEVFSEVPDSAYLNSVLQDLRVSDEQFLADPAYYLANIGRTLYFLVSGRIVSKKEGRAYAAKIASGEEELTLWHSLWQEMSKHLSGDML